MALINKHCSFNLSIFLFYFYTSKLTWQRHWRPQIHASSIDGDSDSLSEFRDISPMKSPMIDETATNMSYKVNGFAHATNAQNHGNQASANGRSISVKKSHSKDSNDSHCDRKENPHHQTNGSSTELSNGIHSSPLRTQLGLNLKSSTTTTPVKKPIISPMTVSSICTHTSHEFPFQLFFLILFRFPVPTVPIFIRQCYNSRGTHKSDAFWST